MDYTKEKLIEKAIKRLEALDDLLKDCQESIVSAIAERRVIRYLLFLASERTKK